MRALNHSLYPSLEPIHTLEPAEYVYTHGRGRIGGRTVSRKPDSESTSSPPCELTPPKTLKGSGVTRFQWRLSTTASPCSRIESPIGSKFHEQRRGFVGPGHASYANSWTTSSHQTVLVLGSCALQQRPPRCSANRLVLVGTTHVQQHFHLSRPQFYFTSHPPPPPLSSTSYR